MTTLLFEGDSFDRVIGRTNVALTREETRHAKGRYNARVNRIIQIDRMLAAGSRSDKSQLLQERAHMLKYMHRYRIALAPHKLLPVEIWQEIFLYVSAGFVNVTPQADSPPLILCRIYSVWRQIAMNMPELWNKLFFSVDSTLTRLQKLAVTRIWFSRAGNTPLSLTLTDSPEDRSLRVDFVAELIAPLSQRFRYLYIVLQPVQVEALLALPNGSFDRVEECHIALNSSFEPSDFIHLPSQVPVTIFSPAARLRRLRLQLTPFVLPQLFIFPWHRLESFRCDSSIEASNCTQMLLSCRALKQIHLRIYAIKYSPPPVVNIPLPNLISLSIQICDKESYDRFFLPLILPSLKSLWIYSLDRLPWSPGMYDALLSRSGCTIEHLSLASIDVTNTEHLLRLFESTPSLISATFSHNTVLNQDLLNRIGRGQIGRNLSRLFLKGIRDLDPLLTLLEMRAQLSTSVRNGSSTLSFQPSRLKFIETYCDLDEIVVNKNRINHLQNRGFHISLLHAVEGYYQL